MISPLASFPLFARFNRASPISAILRARNLASSANAIRSARSIPEPCNFISNKSEKTSNHSGGHGFACSSTMLKINTYFL